MKVMFVRCDILQYFDLTGRESDRESMKIMLRDDIAR